jgi:hypothetical protein
MTGIRRLAALVLIGGAVLPWLVPSPAAAVVVTVGGFTYDVTTSSMSFTIDPTAFQRPPKGQMPWWGDSNLASDFATEVFDQLGPGWDSDYGPVFAYSIPSPHDQVHGLASSLVDINDQIDVRPANGAMVTYAIATIPVPLPLPVLGAAAALGWTHQLRARMRGRTCAPQSSNRDTSA